MANLKLYSPLSRMFFRSPYWDDDSENWPDITMTEGLDVYEEDDRVVVKAAVPGISADKVDITFEDGVLRISGKLEEKDNDRKKKVVYRMDRVSSFDYTTTLPRAIDQSTIEATVEDGVAVVTAKIAEAAKPKKIAVRSRR